MNPTQNYERQPDVICLSHLRWRFVFQRPQHLMSRFARERRVFFVEEPVFDSKKSYLEVATCPKTNVRIVTPHLPQGANVNKSLQSLLSDFLTRNHLHDFLLWFYTPMALEFFPEDAAPSAVVYDCMDELSMFKGAPPQLTQLEQQLIQKADLVFTGGVSLFEAKRHLHSRIHPFPSGVDVQHFMKARADHEEMPEQAGLPRPRIGFAGVIDERFDTELLAQVAARRPDWQFIMIGPTAKISPDSLPRNPNIHWLGMKDYSDLPKYFSGWDAALMPFALNDSTRFISPTKTPEFLAAGLPVVSTPIRDVVRPYGELGLVRIAKTADEVVNAIEASLAMGMSMKWRERADDFLSTQSWDSVWQAMNRLIQIAREKQEKVLTAGSSPLAQAGSEGARV